MDDDLIKWESKYNTNIPKIDEQHKHLVFLINELFKGVINPDINTRDVFKKSMQETVKYVKEHFSYEEGLLILSRYPDYENHKIIHEKFILKVIELATSTNTSDDMRAYEFIKFLRDWLLKHIGVEDRKYSVYVKNTLKI